MANFLTTTNDLKYQDEDFQIKFEFNELSNSDDACFVVRWKGFYLDSASTQEGAYAIMRKHRKALAA